MSLKKIDYVGADINCGVCSWPWQWFGLAAVPCVWPEADAFQL